MLEAILAFLRSTGIKEDTFGRLTCNDPKLVTKLQKGLELTDESINRIMLFMQNYESRQ